MDDLTPEDWTRAAYDFSSASRDQLGFVLVKTFELAGGLADEDGRESGEALEGQLYALHSLRAATFHHDAARGDPLRHLVYGLSSAVSSLARALISARFESVSGLPGPSSMIDSRGEESVVDLTSEELRVVPKEEDEPADVKVDMVWSDAQLTATVRVEEEETTGAVEEEAEAEKEDEEDGPPLLTPIVARAAEPLQLPKDETRANGGGDVTAKSGAATGQEESEDASPPEKLSAKKPAKFDDARTPSKVKAAKAAAKQASGVNRLQQVLARMAKQQGVKQCFGCRKPLPTMAQLAAHFRRVHRMPIRKAGFHLMCGCGVSVDTDHNALVHARGCNAVGFALRRGPLQ